MYITPMSLPHLQQPATARDGGKTPKPKTKPPKRRASLRQKLHLSMNSSSSRSSMDSTETLTSMSDLDSQRFSEDVESSVKEDERQQPATQESQSQAAPSHARSFSDPMPIPNFQRWDGAQRAATEWNCLHKDPDLWHECGNCAIFLYRPGQSQRGPAFRLPFNLLLDARCTPLLDNSLVSTNTGSPWQSDDDSTAGEFFLYLYAPSHLNRPDAFAYHVTTRNFVAWVVGRPLVGVDPLTAMLELKKRMDIWRDPGLDNFRTLLKFTRSQGYDDAHSGPAYFKNNVFTALEDGVRQPQTDNVAEVELCGGTIESRTHPVMGSVELDAPTKRYSLATLPEEPLLELQQISQSPVPVEPIENASNPPPQTDTRYLPQRPAPRPPTGAPKTRIFIPPAVTKPPSRIYSRARSASTSSLTSSPVSVPDLAGGRSSPNSESDTSESLPSSVQTPTVDEVKAFQFGFIDTDPQKEMFDEVISAWEKSGNVAKDTMMAQQDKRKGLRGWGKGVAGKLGERWDGGKDTVDWMQRGVDGGDELKDIVHGLAGK
ncbi:MAG: hypothetical protein Q9160_003034 [Pyrenula sp. 1 TL-2023]